MEKKRNKVKKVSVIVPTHYRDNLLKRALKSIASQTLKPVEVFVVDDTGRKEVRKIVKHFSKNSKITTKKGPSYLKLSNTRNVRVH